MTQVTVTAVCDSDRDLGFECDRQFQQEGVDTLEHIAYFFRAVVSGMDFTEVEEVIFVDSRGRQFSSEDFTGS